MKLGQQLRSGPAKGIKWRGHIQVNCLFDDEMFERVRNKAEKDNTSLSEAIRTLVEWGLEAEES